VDINNDGWDDVYVTDMGTTAPNKIFMNNQMVDLQLDK